MNNLFLYIPAEGKQYFSYYYKIILDYCKQKDIRSITDSHLNTQRNKKTESAAQKKYLNLLIKADLCIFEASFGTIHAGYLICAGLELNKPTIVLFLKGHKPDFLTTVKNDKLILIEYTENNILKKLEAALKNAKASEDKRFNFFISPDQLNYLNVETKKMGLTKSAFIRKLIKDYSKNKHVS